MKLRETVVAIVLLFAVYVLVRTVTGCLPADIQKDTAAGLYELQQGACVDKYADRESIDRCRARVKAKWATDAGKDASHE